MQPENLGRISGAALIRDMLDVPLFASDDLR
jgi:hypothetical protein